jgi:hypothetical protein
MRIKTRVENDGVAPPRHEDGVYLTPLLLLALSNTLT